MLLKAAISLALLIPLLTPTAVAGVIRGTLSLRSTASVNRSANTHEVGPRSQRGISDAVIYVETVPIEVERRLNTRGFWFFRKAASRVARIVQVNRQFNPRVLAVAVGDRVALQNSDGVYHSTFSVSTAKRFDLGKRSPGHCDTLVFQRPGVINLHCDIHADMVGYVVVTTNHAYTRPDSLGRYRLPNLPPGSYLVRAFHPRCGELRCQAEVPKRGDTRLDLSF